MDHRRLVARARAGRASKIAAAAALVALAALVLAACGSGGGSGSGSGGSNGDSKGPVHVALIAFKIPALDFIDDYAAGAEAAVKQINANGGFGGRKVVIDQCNSMLAPAPSTTCAHQTLADHPVAEFGCETSWGATGLEIYAAAGVPSFNCTNSKQDFTNPYSFGMGTGAVGEAGAMAKYICANKPSVKQIAYLTPVDPEQQADVPPLLNKIFHACGKQVTYTFIPQTQVDMTPIITKVLQTHPGFVMTTIGQTQMVEVAKALHQAGYPTDQISVASNALDKKNVLDPAGDDLNGIYASDEWLGWGLTSNADVQAYAKATQGLSNPDSGNVVQGYMYMMWIYTAAKHIGFDKFDSASLTKYMRSTSGVHIPMSRTLVNPGPSGSPAIKQPYVQILRWQNGKMTVVNGGTNGGWVRMFGA
jgi:ABC-type branched-subunit amino acid transport system substrate-binding protein